MILRERRLVTVRGGAWLALVLLVAWACAEPEDRLFEPTVVAPEEVQPGLFRLTWNEGPDVVRGFTADGRIVYLTGDRPAPAVVRLLSVSPEGGAAHEEAALYRSSINQPVMDIAFHAGRRLLSVRSPGLAGIHTCDGCPLPPSAVGLTFLLLEGVDGVALSGVPRLDHDVPVDTGAGTSRPFIRVTPAEQEVRLWGVNPYRPAVVPGSFETFFSDGETVFRYDAATPGAPTPVTSGSFAAVNGDGSLLAVAAPMGLDSTSGSCTAGLDCRQTTVMISTTGWQTTIYDVTSLSVAGGPFAGLEPVFDPVRDRVLVRRFDGLYWIDLGSGAETLVAESSGGFGAALSADGTILAFSANRFGQADVFYVRP